MLKEFASYIVYDLISLEHGSHLGDALEFFIYDTIKIFLLLSIIIFVISIIRSFFPPEKTRKILSHKKEFIGNILAALLGVVTPFCSCSAVPLFIGFVEAGVPLGVTFSFLISSPMVNEVAVVLLWGLFGWKITAIYISTGLLVAIFGGFIIGKLKLEKWVEEYVYKFKTGQSMEVGNKTFRERLEYARWNTADILKRVWLFVIVAIGIGGFIHGYVPEDFLAQYAGKGNPFAVPVAVALGVPLYSNAAGVLPVVYALMEKGMSIGTVLAFMMAVTALSLPEMIILRKVLKIQLLAVFVGIMTITIIAVGYMFNAIL
ncbi:permease [Dissulfurispira thermophila]|uniref:Permease n=1 Tax=Dissulfurispira thermophila TaxID=2715679 RepID=A0A7G1H2K6_9BACT|nr:permease [Dissulfurispira thermophila]BCB97044.1 permease [Dissulfurispira thermophila]